ncbi:MAG: acylphosphatase [Candidatus Hydrogenedentales bacterium]|jgi:acylphosphatase
MAERLRLAVEGRVQGVGFRYATYREAAARGLTGWVRNAYDGRVEAEFEGTREQLEAMLEWCWHGPRYAEVRNVHVEWCEGESHYAQFEILG